MTSWFAGVAHIHIQSLTSVAQVVETSVTLTNSSFQNYTHPDDHTRLVFIDDDLDFPLQSLHLVIAHDTQQQVILTGNSVIDERVGRQ